VHHHYPTGDCWRLPGRLPGGDLWIRWSYWVQYLHPDRRHSRKPFDPSLVQIRVSSNSVGKRIALSLAPSPYTISGYERSALILYQANAKEARKAHTLLQRIERGEEWVEMSLPVIVETIFTLQRCYRVPLPQIKDLLLPILRMRRLRLPSKRDT
jgi:hypothetical protein